MPKHNDDGPETPTATTPSKGAPSGESARTRRLLAQCTSELEHAWSRCRDLFENMPAMSVTTRRGHDGLPIIEDCNRLFPETLGYARDEIIGRPLGDFYAPGSRAEAETQPATGSQSAVSGSERQLLDKYGGVLDTTLYLVVTTTPDGSVSGARATYLDITERKREEQKRRESQSRYQALVAQTLIGVSIVQDGSIVYANQKMADITGYTLEEQAGFLSFLDLVAEEDRQIMSERLRRYQTPSSTPETQVVHVRRKDDRTVPLEVQGAPIRFGERPAVAVVVLDISDRIRLQNQLQQSQRLDDPGETTAVAEIGNDALTAIRGHCEELLDVIGPADPRRKPVEAIRAIVAENVAATPHRGSPGQNLDQTEPADATGQDAGGTRDTSTPSQTVLLVEDEGAVRAAVLDWLQQVGYRVLEAADGDAALKLAAAHDGPINLILTDVKMPGMTGWRLTEELARTREPIPVIYMSGFPDPAHPLDEGDNAAVLQKPFTPRTLIKAVQLAMDSPAPARQPLSDPERDNG